jgi:hypothetical protein
MPSGRPTVQGADAMKTIMLLTGSGPIIVLTSYASVTDQALLGKLQGKGIKKFIAFEIPLELAKQRYGGHFSVVVQDLRESDDLRILDYDGQRGFQLFRFAELAPPVFYEEDGPGSQAPQLER